MAKVRLNKWNKKLSNLVTPAAFQALIGLVATVWDSSELQNTSNMHKVLLDSVVAIQSLELNNITQEGPSFVILDKLLEPL